MNASEFPVSIRFDKRDIKRIPLDADSDSRLFSWGIEKPNDFLSKVDGRRMSTDKKGSPTNTSSCNAIDK